MVGVGSDWFLKRLDMTSIMRMKELRGRLTLSSLSLSSHGGEEKKKGSVSSLYNMHLHHHLAAAHSYTAIIPYPYSSCFQPYSDPLNSSASSPVILYALPFNNDLLLRLCHRPYPRLVPFSSSSSSSSSSSIIAPQLQ
eukprot:751960-Hanusia_phi.AAC.3